MSFQGTAPIFVNPVAFIFAKLLFIVLELLIGLYSFYNAPHYFKEGVIHCE